MSKGLEDFKELKKTTCFYCQYHINEECVNDICIWNSVEKELKEHEQYKVIEKELGIDLVTLIKALKQGFYFKDNLGNISFLSGNIIKQMNKDKYESFINVVSSYGKTWALTKEELL